MTQGCGPFVSFVSFQGFAELGRSLAECALKVAGEHGLG